MARRFPRRRPLGHLLGLAALAALAALLHNARLAAGFSCPILFDLRQAAIQSGDHSARAQYSQALRTLGCCRPTSPSTLLPSAWTSRCSKTSGPVCGFDFVTHASQCDVGICLAGQQSVGQCRAPEKHLTQCQKIADINQRLVCLKQILARVVQAVAISDTPVDPARRLAAPCVVPGQYDRTRFRTADGSCNNPTPDRSYSGMAGLYFIRHDKTRTMPADIDRAVAAGPNPRVLSNALLRRSVFQPNSVQLNGLAIAFLTFFIHDFFEPRVDWSEVIAVPIPHNDPDFPSQAWAGAGAGAGAGAEAYMYIPATARNADGTVTNHATAWLDTSQVYGSSEAVQASLREFQGGRLRVDAATGLPPDEPTSQSGARRLAPGAPPLLLLGDSRGNQHIGLTAFHALFVSEHNNLAKLLAQAYPAMSDEELFQTARLILAAEVFKIQTVELSSQLSTDPAKKMLAEQIWSSHGSRNYNENFGVHLTPFDFTSAYRLHSMMPASFQPLDIAGFKVGERIDYFHTYHNSQILRDRGVGAILRGLATEVAGHMSLNNHPAGIRRLTHSDVVFQQRTPYHPLGPAGPAYQYAQQGTCYVAPFIDLGVVDIVRDRERAVPRANEYYRRCGLPELAAPTFAYMAQDPVTAARMAELYDWQIEQVDLAIGMLGMDSADSDGVSLLSSTGFLPFVAGRASLDRFYSNTWLTPAVYTAVGYDRLMGTASNPTGVTLTQIMEELGHVNLPLRPNGAIVPTEHDIFRVWNWPKLPKVILAPE
ncbi:hypothetical protein H696_05788 [Fonticula alba]|uniref:Kazal-like domain-containing protein n=1 Tax=Fonticula alba TaxID=691883 RepID=A0A058Z159_FONAL|nr:hypothetical protein H696_05788 [Fonticula alba]KCV67678.1 hypothetical protein H696_05788 [Fonticula alba]|eukprot:XP_009497862.1 hypothetical protein H696_05788 [Fonticula alba]